jgi:hypothetical protein
LERLRDLEEVWGKAMEKPEEASRGCDDGATSDGNNTYD